MKKDCLGDYELIKQINKSALVTTYLARHRFIKKHFILKRLCTSLTKEPNFLERLEKMMPKLSLLNHINLCQIHTISKDEDTYFIVYENFYEKHPNALVLSDFLKACSDKLQLEVIESILLQIGSVCDYIHTIRFNQAKLLHGAIYLDSIYISKTSENSYHVILSDLGLFYVLGSANLVLQGFSSTLSCLKEGVGPHIQSNFNQITVDEGDCTLVSKMHQNFLSLYSFLSPEQKKETLQKVNYKSDIYQIGVLAYYLFMGHFPCAYFPLASRNFTFELIDWDLFLQRSLELFASKRAGCFSTLIDECKKKELSEIQEGLKKFVKPKIETDPSNDGFDSFNSLPDENEDSYSQHEAIEKSLIHGTSVDHENDRQEGEELSTCARHHALEKSLMQGVGSRTKVSQIAAQDTSDNISLQPKQKKITSVIKSDDKTKGVELQKTNQLVSPVKVQTMLKPKINPSEVKKHAYEKDPGAIFKKPLQVSTYKPKVEKNRQIEPLLNEMVVVSGGQYVRGSDQGARDEKPRHTIEVADFAIDIYPVTNEQFICFLQVMASEKDSDNNDTITLKDSRIKKSNGQYSIETGYSKHPVVGVSWYGAKAYATWSGKRLPTEAEWEIAAQGTASDALYFCGQDIERSSANYFSSDTTAVMSYPPNNLGLYDVAGNVYEWVEDWYCYNYYETSSNEPNNPLGPQQGVYRVLRGGCWKSLKDDLRLSHRHRNNPKTMNSTYGFRLAADAEKES